MKRRTLTTVWRHLLALLVIAAVLMPTTPVWAQASSPPADFDTAMEQLRFGEYAAAATALEAIAERDKATDIGAQALYYAGHARQSAGDLARAVTLYRQFLARYGDHALSDKVRFRCAECLLATNRHAEAAEIFAAASHRLTAAERSREVAARFVEMGDRLFDGVQEPDPLIPNRTVTRHDFPRAAQMYQSALNIGLDGDAALRAKRRIADAFANANRWADAANAWRVLVNDTATPADVRQDAQYGAAMASLRANQLDQAATMLHEIIAVGEKHPRYADALWERAQLFARPRWDFNVARASAEAFIAARPNDPQIPQVRMWLASMEFQNGFFTASAERLSHFIALHGDRAADVANARLMRANALTNARRFDDALAAYREFLARHANHEAVAQARSAIRNVVMQHAQTATERANARPTDSAARQAAIDAWGRLIEEFPSDAEVVNALRRIAELMEAGGDFGGAIEMLRRIAAQYPPHARSAILAVARIYETRLGEEDRALEEYRRLQQMRQGDDGGIHRLTSPELALATESVATTDGKPVVAVSARNIRDLICRAYRLDLLEYFRRKKETGNVERLMVDVLRPDKSWTFEVPDFRDYRRLSFSVECPVQGAGAHVITIANEKFAGRTLVISSDLELVVKTSPTQLLVLAMNARTKAPWAGVNLLMFDVNGRAMEAQTGADGIYLYDVSGKTAAEQAAFQISNVKLFAAADDHYAFHNFGSLLDTLFAYTAKGYAFTDRPLYRAGESVQFKAMVRDVRDGAYVLPEAADAQYRVICLDPRNQQIWQRQITLSDMGTADGALQLGDETASGQYTLNFESVSRRLPNFSATFHVRPFERPEFEIVAEFDKALYGIRESAKLAITARRYTGSPLADQQITVTIYTAVATYQPSAGGVGAAWFFDDRPEPRQVQPQGAAKTFTLVTNSEGKTEIDFVPDLPVTPVGGQFVRVIADLRAQADTGTQVASQAVAAVAGMSAFVQLVPRSETVRQGDEASVTVRAETVLNAPAAISATFRLFRGENMTEFNAREALVTTTKKIEDNGRLELTFRPDEPGTYTVVAEARGRFGELIIGKCEFRVVAPDDTERRDLVVMTDKPRYFAGETATITILAPVRVPTALLTVETDRVIHHRLIALDRREIRLPISVESDYMPNVRIAVATIAEGRLMLGQTELAVQKLLNVELRTDREIYRPGDEVEAVIRATDQLGRPVAAEVAIAVIDEAVYALEPDAAGDVRARFYNVVRQITVQTAASVGWRYQGSVTETDPDVLMDARTQERLLREEMTRDLENESGLAMPADDLRAMPGRAMRPSSPSPNSAAAEMDRADGAGGFAMRRSRGGGGSAGEQAQLQIGVGMTVRTDFRLTAAFLPAVRTNADGVATVRFTLPETVATWRFTARGITRDTQVGEARHSVKTVLPFYGALDIPRVATEGDVFEIAAQFVNETTRDGDIHMMIGEENATPRPVVKVTLNPENMARMRLTPQGVREALRQAGAQVTPGSFIVDEHVGIVLRAANEAELPRIVVGTHNGRRVLLSQVATLARATETPNFGEHVGATAVGAAGVVRANFSAYKSGDMMVTALGRMADEQDALRRPIRVQPFGEPVRSAFSGRMQGDGRASARVNLPAGAIAEATRLSIHVTPTMADSLLDSLDYLREYPYGCIEQTVHRFFPGLQVFAALRDLEHRAPQVYAETKKVVEMGLSRVIALQNQDGGWGWWQGNQSNPQLTALCYDALMTSMHLDFPVPPQSVERARNFMHRHVPTDGRTLNRSDAMILAALAASSVADSELTPFHDRRTRQLVSRALSAQRTIAQASADVQAFYILAAYGIDEGRLAASVVPALAQGAKIERLPSGEASAHWTAATDTYSYGGSDVEVTALALRALAVANAHRAMQVQAVAWLESQKRGRQWRATRDTAMVVQAYVAYMKAERNRGASVGNVKVNVNGQLVGTIVVGDDRTKHTLELRGTSMLQSGDNVIELIADTNATPSYTGTLATVVAADNLSARSAEMSIRREYRPGPSRYRVAGAELFESGVTRASRPSTIDTVGHGDLIQVALIVRTDRVRDEVMIEDPLPAGCEPIGTDVAGVSRFEHREGKVVMFFDRLPVGERTITYTVRAVRSGEYRVLPTMASMMYFPEIWARGAHAKLTVLTAADQMARLARTSEARAGELFAALQTMGVGEEDKAIETAKALLAFSDLRANIRGDLHRLVLGIAFARRDHGLIRESLDSLSSLNQSAGSLDVPTQMIAGDAYRTARPLQALAYYRSALDAMYTLERNAAALVVDGDRQATELRRLLDRFPDSHTLLLHRSEWAQTAAEAAPSAERNAVYLDALRRLAAESTGYWNRWALYQIATRLVEIGQYDKAKAFSERWLSVLDPATEPLTDNVIYIAAFVSFAQQDLPAAETFATRLVEGRFVDDGNSANPQSESFFYISPERREALRRARQLRMEPSDMRPIGALMLGQINHARGDLATAVRWYREAAGRFEDARLALKELTSVEFDVPAFVRVASDDETLVPVTGRNVANVTVDVYPFDLLYCFTVRKHLRDLHTIDLTGLRAEQTHAMALQMTPHERAQTHVNLGKLATGAYLVLVKAGDQVRSSIVLVTNLQVEARREGNVVRIAVTDATGRPVPGAYVKVSDGARIVATGRTDVRGIFQSPAGTSVLVERNGEYALVPAVR